MITILKIPVYLSVETDDQDRAKVTKTVQQMVIPRIIKTWQTRGFAGFFDSVDNQRVEAVIGDIDIKLLTDVEAMAGR